MVTGNNFHYQCSVCGDWTPLRLRAYVPRYRWYLLWWYMLTKPTIPFCMKHAKEYVEQNHWRNL